MRAATLTVVLISLTVAGCIAGPAETSEAQDWPTITDPKNLSYDTDSGMHIHDYWGGEDSVQVIDRSQNSGAFSQDATTQEETRVVHRFLPADGNVVPQGTASMDVTVSWTEGSPANHHGDVELWVETANDTEPRLVEDELVNGEPLEIPVAYEEADLPHRTVSTWEFQVHFRGDESLPTDYYEGVITVEATAHRGLELRPFPPHPDHWGDRTEIELFDGTRGYTRVDLDGLCYGCDTAYFRPDNGTLVPVGTDLVEATMEWDRDIPGGKLNLSFRGAHTRDFQPIQPAWIEDSETAESGMAGYRIPVTDEMADTPYADASLWEFKVDVPTDGNQQPYFGGDVSLNATAYKE